MMSLYGTIKLYGKSEEKCDQQSFVKGAPDPVHVFWPSV